MYFKGKISHTGVTEWNVKCKYQQLDSYKDVYMNISEFPRWKFKYFLTILKLKLQLNLHPVKISYKFDKNNVNNINK